MLWFWNKKHYIPSLWIITSLSAKQAKDKCAQPHSNVILAGTDKVQLESKLASASLDDIAAESNT